MENAFYGYASVFNVKDSYNDMVLPTAFRESLKLKKTKNIKLLWQHDQRKSIGYFTNIYEDQIGLFVEGKFDNYNVYNLVKNNLVNGLSIGYRVKKCDIDTKNRRILKDLDLIEISLVNFPANKHSKITYCK
ncbi:MAG: HK97 family phage prohead protease [Rickettsiales bacterium]|jgi:HK97 family phage prohead protease|nr:HK97 family phage prohead protease [Rickettsiales bacterium]